MQRTEEVPAHSDAVDAGTGVVLIRHADHKLACRPEPEPDCAYAPPTPSLALTRSVGASVASASCICQSVKLWRRTVSARTVELGDGRLQGEEGRGRKESRAQVKAAVEDATNAPESDSDSAALLLSTTRGHRRSSPIQLYDRARNRVVLGIDP